MQYHCLTSFAVEAMFGVLQDIFLAHLEAVASLKSAPE
jgi:hypothetical protein